jgi:hypothetical protein
MLPARLDFNPEGVGLGADDKKKPGRGVVFDRAERDGAPTAAPVSPGHVPDLIHGGSIVVKAGVVKRGP